MKHESLLRNPLYRGPGPRWEVECARGPTDPRTVIMKASLRGPDKTGRMWDRDYTEVEFLACLMECGTQADFVTQRPFDDYWKTVDVWFNRHYPERWESGSEPVRGQGRPETFTCQMGFKIALWNYLGEHDGASKDTTVQKHKR